MRRAALLLLALLLPIPVGAQPSGDLRIMEILPQPDGPLGQREFIELANTGSAALDLAGWRLRDAPTASNSTNDFTFPSYLLYPGQRVVIWSNGSQDGGFTFSQSPSKTIWNDGGDAASLLDPAGALRDWVGYGSTTQAPGFPAKAAAPPRGKSLQLDNTTWITGTPTPGLAPGQQGGGISGQVANVPPTVLVQAPASVGAGSSLAVSLLLTDDNGPDDVQSWSIAANAKVLRAGNASFTGNLSLSAPTTPGDWRLTVSASDRAGATSQSNVTVRVSAPKLAVTLPVGGSLHFPVLRPGDRNVTSLDAFTVRNEGEHEAVPLLDISDFRSATGRIDVAANLWIGYTVNGATTWIRYEGPLEPLPGLAANQTASVVLRLGNIPVPTPAGTYGTTFTVVPA